MATLIRRHPDGRPGPVAVGTFHDLNGTYTPTLWGMVATSVLAALCIARVGLPTTTPSERAQASS